MGWSVEQREHSQGPLSTEPRWPHASAAAPTQHDHPISSWVGKAMRTAQAMPGSWGCWHRAHTGPEQQRGGCNPTSRCGQGFTSRLRGEGLLQPLSSPWASGGPWWVHGHPFLWLCLSSFCRRLSLGWIFPFHQDTGLTGLGPTPLTSSKLDHMQRPSFQLSHVQGEGVRTAASLGVGRATQLNHSRGHLCVFGGLPLVGFWLLACESFSQP